MRTTVRNVAISISVMTGPLLYSATAYAEGNEALLDAPAGLEWLESKDSLIDRGYITTFADFVDVYGYDPDEYETNSLACTERACFGKPEQVSETVTEYVGLNFEDDLLVGIELTYLLDVEAITGSELEITSRAIYEALIDELSKKYSDSDESSTASRFNWNAVEIKVGESSNKDSNNDIVEAWVYAQYEFDIDLYSMLSSKQKYSEIFSVKDL